MNLYLNTHYAWTALSFKKKKMNMRICIFFLPRILYNYTDHAMCKSVVAWHILITHVEKYLNNNLWVCNQMTWLLEKSVLTFGIWTLSLYPKNHCRPEAGCQTAVSLGPNMTKHLPPKTRERKESTSCIFLFSLDSSDPVLTSESKHS